MEITIEIEDREFTVDFDYQPYEAMTRHYPGCDECAEINEVLGSNGDIIEDYSQWEDEIQEACLDAVHDDQDRLTDAQEEYADRLLRDRKIDIYNTKFPMSGQVGG